MTPHKHAAVIKAWADGAEIEWRSSTGDWIPKEQPPFFPDHSYRVKPEPKSLGQIYYEGAAVAAALAPTQWENLPLSTQIYLTSRVDAFVAALKANNLEIREIR